jgi:hypothetical protein
MFRKEKRRQDGSCFDLVSDAIVGVLIDFPHLARDPDLARGLLFLTGDSRETVMAIVAGIDDAVPGGYFSAYLARKARRIHHDADLAKKEALANLEKIQRRFVKAYCAEDKADGFSLLAEAQLAARKKHEASK